MGDILVVAEHVDGKIKRYSFELTGKASELSRAIGGCVTALLIGGDDIPSASELGRYGASKIIVAKHTELKSYSSEGYSKTLCDVIANEKPSVVLGTASVFGKDLLARTAMRLAKGLASDCVGISVKDGKIFFKRPIYAGKALIELTINGDTQFATIRPNSFPLPEPTSSTANITAFAADPGNIRAKVSKRVEAEIGMLDLTEADRIVSGGRAMGSKENFSVILDLAKALGATVGASRAAVDAGYISHDHQVGQTGKTVNPSLYIACGISGAIQHLAGMRTAKVIVAINKDPEAQIFSKADYGIVGDLFKIVPLLADRIRKLLQE